MDIVSGFNSSYTIMYTFVKSEIMKGNNFIRITSIAIVLIPWCILYANLKQFLSSVTSIALQYKR